MKFIHLILSIIFLSFAIVQWNDPDSFIWILVYLIISLIAFMAVWSRYFYWFNLVFSLILLLSLLFYIPDIVNWFEDGMPNIASSMKASSPYIELVREFFGLLISLLTMSFYLALSKKKRT